MPHWLVWIIGVPLIVIMTVVGTLLGWLAWESRGGRNPFN